MASPGVREPHMPPVVYVQLASADVARARANLRAAAAHYLTADVSYTAAEERLMNAVFELRYVRHVHEQHVNRDSLLTQAPDKCSSCQQELSQADVDANWGRCESCL